ncbi:MAG TPA: glycosyltransferase [Candidatus Paceibacterota bacterium]|nr:glycosyltransferase [Candidatus Paceibacterota bacterium]
MTLYYVANDRVPTAKAYGYTITKMCDRFAALGAAVTLVLPSRTGADSDTLFSYYALPRTFSVRTLACIGSGEPKTSWLYTIRLYVQNLSFAVAFLFMPIERDAVIYLRNLYLVPLARLKTRNVFVETHYLHAREKRLRSFFRMAKGVIVTTNALKEALARFGVSPEAVHVAHDAVDLSTFDIELSKVDARAALALPTDAYLALYSGSFRTMGMDKGITTILEALAHIGALDRPVLFLAVGGNDTDVAYYEALARKLGVADCSRFVRRMPLDVLAKYQKAADVLLMPFPRNEHYTYYMSPLKMFEYMAAKRPIVASNLPAIREVLDETTASIVEPDAPEKVAKAMRRIFLDSASGERLAEAAYRKVREGYTWDMRAEQVLKFISGTKPVSLAQTRERPEQDTIPVVFVVGAGHSGSTLLGLLLGQHPGIADVGEISHYRRWSAAGDLCACGEPVATCPFWRAVFAGHDYTPLLYRRLGAFLTGTLDYRTFDTERGRETSADVERYVRDAEAAYAAVLKLSGKKAIADVSKSIDRAELLMRRSSRINPILLHLVRDGRGVVYSNVKVGRPVLPEIRKWLAVNLKVEIVRRRNPGIRYLRMRYEDVVADTAGELKRITDLLGLPFKPTMPEYRLEGQHIVSGNPRHRSKDRSIGIDLSWKAGFSRGGRIAFFLVAGWLNMLYQSWLHKGARKS